MKHLPARSRNKCWRQTKRKTRQGHEIAMHPVVSIATIFRGLFLFVELCHADAHRSFQLQGVQTWKMRPHVSLVSAISTCPSLSPLRTFWSMHFSSSFMSKQIHWHWSLTNRKHGWFLLCFALPGWCPTVYIAVSVQATWPERELAVPSAVNKASIASSYPIAWPYPLLAFIFGFWPGTEPASAKLRSSGRRGVSPST